MSNYRDGQIKRLFKLVRQAEIRAVCRIRATENREVIYLHFWHLVCVATYLCGKKYLSSLHTN